MDLIFFRRISLLLIHAINEISSAFNFQNVFFDHFTIKKGHITTARVNVYEITLRENIPIAEFSLKKHFY